MIGAARAEAKAWEGEAWLGKAMERQGVTKPSYGRHSNGTE